MTVTLERLCRMDYNSKGPRRRVEGVLNLKFEMSRGVSGVVTRGE